MGRPAIPIGTHQRINVVQLAPDQWVARTKVRDADGVRRAVERRRPTKTKALNALAEAIRDRGTRALHGVLTASSLVSDAAELYFEEVAASGLATGTRRHYRTRWTKHLQPAFAQVTLAEVTVGRIDDVMRCLTPNTARGCRIVLSNIMGLAVRHGAITRNPCRDTSRIHVPRKRARALGVADTAELLRKLEADQQAQDRDLVDLIRFGVGTGVRIGEALGLCWDHVDLAAGTAHIELQAQFEVGRGVVLNPTKSAAGDRVLALPAFLVLVLTDRWRPDYDPAAPVFPGPRSGRLRDATNVGRYLKEAFTKAGYGWATFHTFRRTAITTMDDAGMTARQIADHVGHARITTTLDDYMGRKRMSPAAARALDRAAAAVTG